ncbi:hypothetical protein THAOC_27696, partial [Thalassiosira oceanica]
ATGGTASSRRRRARGARGGRRRDSPWPAASCPRLLLQCQKAAGEGEEKAQEEGGAAVAWKEAATGD